MCRCTPEIRTPYCGKPGCEWPIPPGTKLGILPDQGEQVDFTTVDAIFIKVIRIPKAWSIVPQHAHDYDHATFLAHGSVWLWHDGRLDRQYHAPEIIEIRAGVLHTFQTLVDNTVLLCLHNLNRPELAAVLDQPTVAELNEIPIP